MENKPILVEQCTQFKVCKSAKKRDCVGCNVWNYLYNIEDLHKWCEEHNKDFIQFTMKMHKMLKECNVWNYLYNIEDLHKWCEEHNKDFMQFTMKMHKMLKEKN